MEFKCSNCRYNELPVDAYPCVECCRCADVRTDHWAQRMEDISDPFVKISATAEVQMYLMMEMCKLRGQLDDLIKEVHRRNE